ncbi:MAG: hypothetical protein PWP40_2959, partial [Rhodocyclaceae bacterium]|nr:hypothetical protein [Rhodocyclaceae bacterium]
MARIGQRRGQKVSLECYTKGRAQPADAAAALGSAPACAGGRTGPGTR